MPRDVVVQRLLSGTGPLSLTLPVGNAPTIEAFLIAHAKDLFPSHNVAPSTPMLGTWENLAILDTSGYPAVARYGYATDLGEHGTKVHLVDQVPDHLVITGPNFVSEDRLWFFLLEQFASNQSGNDVLNTTVGLRSLEAFFAQRNTYIVQENAEQANRSIRALVQHHVPARVWRRLSAPKLQYYQDLLLRLGRIIVLLGACLDRKTDTDMIRVNKNDWLHNTLYQLHTHALVLLSMPEAILRASQHITGNYAAGLGTLGMPAQLTATISTTRRASPDAVLQRSSMTTCQP